jgi:ribosome-associated protein
MIFYIHTPYIQLNQLLKASGLAETGGQAKMMIEDGLVKVNDQQESRIRAKLKAGDRVEAFSKTVLIQTQEEE